MKKNVKKGKNIKKKKDDKTIKFVVFAGLALLAIAIFVFAFSEDNKYVLKSEYQIGEVGYIDDIEITLASVNYINNNTGIELTFELTNKRDNTITIIPEDYFVFYDINKVQIPNKYTNDKNIIKKDEKIIYKLQYDVTKKELYEIYFYSQIVENNIKFSFKASDINSNVLPEDEDKVLEENPLEE